VRSSVTSKLGVCSIVISCLLWLSIVAIPLLPGSIAHKATITASLIILSEVTFWLGILLAGKELAQRYHRKLNPYYWWQQITSRK
jgi:ABC-type dipeptide/oligopeptide/nickel transport system permease component